MRHRVPSSTELESESMIELTSPVSEKKDFYSFDRVFLQRFKRLLSILFRSPRHDRFWSWSSKARYSNLFWLYIAFIAVSCGNEILYYYVGLLPSRFYSLLSSKDLSGFLHFIAPCLLLVFGAAAGKSILTFMGGLFSLKTRQLLTEHLHRRYIKPKTMYALVLKHSDTIDNPDQRIAQDIDKFAEALREIVEKLIIAPILVAYYTWRCWTVGGFLGPVMIYGYFIAGSAVSQWLIRPIVSKVFYKELEEGNFRFLHVRLRQFAEPIAFSRGEAEEHTRATNSLSTLLEYQRAIINKELPLNLANESFSYFGSILSYLIVAMPIFAGAFDDKDSSELSSIISQNSFFAMYLIYRFTVIIEQSNKISDLAGYTARIAELLEAVNDVDDELDDIRIGNQHVTSERDEIVFDNVRLQTPRSKTLVSGLSLTISRGEHLAIIGPNGCGKSSTLRALAGLWPCSEGRIHIPNARPGKDIIFLPQMPYLVYGSLKDQITYPSSSLSSNVSDREVRELLEKVRLEHLEELIPSFDTPLSQEWDKLLSPGEQQRLMFARVLYWKPVFAALDEATSAMDADTEDHIYSLLIKTGITLISVSHHAGLSKFHKRRLILDGYGGYGLETITNQTFDESLELPSTEHHSHWR